MRLQDKEVPRKSTTCTQGSGVRPLIQKSVVVSSESPGVARGTERFQDGGCSVACVVGAEVPVKIGNNNRLKARQLDTKSHGATPQQRRILRRNTMHGKAVAAKGIAHRGPRMSVNPGFPAGTEHQLPGAMTWRGSQAGNPPKSRHSKWPGNGGRERPRGGQEAPPSWARPQWRVGQRRPWHGEHFI